MCQFPTKLWLTMAYRGLDARERDESLSEVWYHPLGGHLSHLTSL